MSQLVDLLQGVASFLRADLTRLPGVNVSVHGGNFNDQELRKYAAKAPHLVVAMLKSPITRQGGFPTAEAGLVCVVIEADRKGAANDRHTRALALTDAALRALNRITVPGLDQVSNPREIDARNLYSRAWDDVGISAWAISWVQTIRLLDTNDLELFKVLDTKYDITPRDNDAPLGEIPEAEDYQVLIP